MRLNRRTFAGLLFTAALGLSGVARRCLAVGPFRRMFGGGLLIPGTVYSMWVRGRIAATPLMFFMPLLSGMQRAFGISPTNYYRCRQFNGTLLGRLAALVTLPVRIRRARMEAAIMAHEIQCQQMFLGMFATQQVQRFQQILMQMKGAMAVGEAKTQELLTLTQDQKKRVGTIITDFEKKMTDGADSAGTASGVATLLQTPKLTQLKEERDTKLNEVLTAEQKAKLTEMQGEPFEGIQKLLKEPLTPDMVATPEELPPPAAEGTAAKESEKPAPEGAKPDAAKPQAADKPVTDKATSEKPGAPQAEPKKN